METLWHYTIRQRRSGLGVMEDIVEEPHVLEASATHMDSKIGKSGFAAMEKSSGFTSTTKSLETSLRTTMTWHFIIYRKKNGFKHMAAGSAKVHAWEPFARPQTPHLKAVTDQRLKSIHIIRRMLLLI